MSDLVLDGYRLRSLVGSGPRGRVYLAEQRTPMRVLTLKVLSSSQPDTLADTLESWFEAHSRIRHDKVVPVHGIGAQGRHVFITSHYQDGEGFWSVLDAGPLPMKAGIHLVIDVLGILEDLHMQGICHGDLRPSNIILDPEGKPHLTDVMLALKLEGTPLDSPERVDGRELSEWTYQTPDQRLHRRWVGKQADLYAMGALLYHVVTGQIPVIGEALGRELRPIDARLVPIIERLLSSDPSDRYLSAREALEDLKAVHHAMNTRRRPRRRGEEPDGGQTSHLTHPPRLWEGASTGAAPVRIYTPHGSRRVAEERATLPPPAAAAARPTAAVRLARRFRPLAARIRNQALQKTRSFPQAHLAMIERLRKPPVLAAVAALTLFVIGWPRLDSVTPTVSLSAIGLTATANPEWSMHHSTRVQTPRDLIGWEGERFLVIGSHEDSRGSITEVDIEENHHVVTPLSERPGAIQPHRDPLDPSSPQTLLTLPDSRKVLRVDLSRGRTLAAQQLDRSPKDLRSLGAHLVVLTEEGEVRLYDPEFASYQPIEGRHDRILGAPGTALYLLDEDHLHRLVPPAGFRVGPLAPTSTVEIAPHTGVALDPEGRRVALTDARRQNLVLLDAGTLEVRSTVGVADLIAGDPAFEVGSSGLWVPTREGVRLVDPSSGRVLEDLALDPGPKVLRTWRDRILVMQPGTGLIHAFARTDATHGAPAAG